MKNTKNLFSIDEIISHLADHGIDAESFGPKGLKAGAITMEGVSIDKNLEGDMRAFIEFIEPLYHKNQLSDRPQKMTL